MTLSINFHHNSIECHYAECLYADCRDYLNVMLRVIMLSVVRLNVVMLSVVAPLGHMLYTACEVHALLATFARVENSAREY